MVLVMRVLIILSITIYLTPVTYAVPGSATFYDPPYLPSACYGYTNNGAMIAAASDAIWNNNNRSSCGRMYRVRCTGATKLGVPQPCKGESIVVKIVDYCPPGCAGTIALSKEAFYRIANTNAGRRVRIEYTE